MWNILNKHLLPLFLVLVSYFSMAQDSVYRATRVKINDLVHTKLDVSFDYQKQYLMGEEWLTLKPHFYPTDSLTLDAKGMDILKVALADGRNLKSLQYVYDSLQLRIKLDRKYADQEKYTVYIQYVSKPNELKATGSQAITDAKGLYFINPDSSEAGKPVQIWTQGETEASSVWFPTIDSPNQKTTSEISMTVPSKYVSLSNGYLASQKDNKNGTRTDTWKMDKPHSPYLFMMAVGNFKVYHDKWKNVPVDYYLEPAYAPYAKQIFGNTPEMMEFFSKKLGVDYPWNKYAQIVVRDFVSGAMENTTATLHGDFVQKTERELLDGSDGEDVIAHELFHHWFGDYVTTESWSNLSLNESFADFSETLWNEYKYGKDAGDATNYSAMMAYLGNNTAKEKDLIRFYYHDKEDMFDVVSYQKGGRILYMLRNYLGEDAFFKALQLYLTSYAYQNTEAHQLRMAFEEVSGKDLNWFFNQWYFGAGHPELSIDYHWDEGAMTQYVYLRQNQAENVFKLPMKIDLHSNGKAVRETYFMEKRADTLSFKMSRKPDWINVDAEKVLLVKKTDNKSLEEFALQYQQGTLYLDRLEALNAAIKEKNALEAHKIIASALQDPYYSIRIRAIKSLDPKQADFKSILNLLKEMAVKDDHTLVQAAAIDALSDFSSKDEGIFEQSLKSRSYTVQASALAAIAKRNKDKAMSIARSLQEDSKGELATVILELYAQNGSAADFEYALERFKEADLQNQFSMLQNYATLMVKVNNLDQLERGVELMKDFGERYQKYGFDKYINGLLEMYIEIKKKELDKVAAAARPNIKKQIDYVQRMMASAGLK